jgi:hypothetical protein
MRSGAPQFLACAASPTYTQPTSSPNLNGHKMSNEMSDEPLKEIQDIQKRIEKIVDKENAMMIAGLPLGRADHRGELGDQHV